MKRGAQHVPLAAMGITVWAALWSLMALSSPELPAVSERSKLEQPVKTSIVADAAASAALEGALADKAAAALGERLGAAYGFEMIRLESLTLHEERAEALLWGLLVGSGQAPSMLRVELHLDRHSQRVEYLHAQAYTEQADDPIVTAWIASDPGTLQAAR